MQTTKNNKKPTKKDLGPLPNSTFNEQTLKDMLKTAIMCSICNLPMIPTIVMYIINNTAIISINFKNLR